MTARPRLLFISPRFPWPLDRGDRLRSYHLIRSFSPHADITLVSFTDGPAAAAPIDPLLELCRRVEVVTLSDHTARLRMIAAIPGSLPFQVAYFRSEAMERLVDRLDREGFDLAFGHMFRIYPYLERLQRTPRYLDFCDSLSMTYRRAAPLKPAIARLAFQQETRRVEAYESRALDGIREGWVVSPIDRDDLLRRRPRASVEVVPNGVEGRWGDAGLEGPKESAVLFLGNLTVGHNVDAILHFAAEVWPLVRQAVPEARLELAGLAAPKIKALDGRNGVVVHGFVADLAPLLRRSRAAVAPIRYAAGIQNKVLETIAAGLPAVVSSLAAKPLGAEPGRELVVADDPGEQAAEIVALLRDDGRGRLIGLAGQAFVRRNFSWDRAGSRLSEILAGLQ